MRLVSGFAQQFVFAGAFLLLGMIPGIAASQTLYGITLTNNELITIDTATGAGKLVGPLSSNLSAIGLAFRGPKLYAYDQIAFKIRELDTATGITIGTIDLGKSYFSEGDIAFRSDGIGFLSAVPPAGLFQFDITVPSSSLVALTGGKLYDGLAFNSADVLYGLDLQGGRNLYRSTK